MWSCPICNGFIPLEKKCSECQANMVDEGRISDYYAPYSPYRNIEDLKLSNGYMDATNHQCIHYIVCPSCGKEENIAIAEQNETEIYTEYPSEDNINQTK